MKIADSAPAPIVRGRDLIALGMRPGVEFGKVLNACYEAQLDGAFADLRGGIAYVRERMHDILQTQKKRTEEKQWRNL